MPKIAVSIFVDNQEVIGYPVGYVCSRLGWADEIWVHAGDAVSHALVSEECGKYSNVKTHIIDYKVREFEGTIAWARNKCLDFLRENSSCDWFVVLSADTLPTPLGAEEIAKCCDRNIVIPASISTHMAAMYSCAGYSRWGCTVMPRSCQMKFGNDGSYLEGVGNDSATPLAMCVHLGYLSADMMGRHHTQHRKLWVNGTNDNCVSQYQGDRGNFIAERLIDIRDRRLMTGSQTDRRESRLVLIDEPDFMKVDSRYPWRGLGESLSQEYMLAIDAMGLKNEMQYVRSIADAIGRDPK